MAYTFNTELKSVASAYVKVIQARVTENTIIKEIEEHPYYPSLLALSDTFSRYKIVNSAFRIAKDDFVNVLKDTPFVAFVNIEGIGPDFVLVTKCSSESVKYYHKKRTFTFAVHKAHSGRIQPGLDNPKFCEVVG